MINQLSQNRIQNKNCRVGGPSSFQTNIWLNNKKWWCW